MRFRHTIKHIFNCLMEKAMRKTYNLENLDCANCAAKIENAVRQLNGIKDVSVSFMTQKITVETDENFEEILAQIKKNHQ